ncbi:hypothetical protein B0H13DRAFT_2332698 [Mycena leptocephala]|nr:hypothetical protein B0H13DRAFT_2332698 [Mycena leptocephala]
MSMHSSVTASNMRTMSSCMRVVHSQTKKWYCGEAVLASSDGRRGRVVIVAVAHAGRGAPHATGEFCSPSFHAPPMTHSVPADTDPAPHPTGLRPQLHHLLPRHALFHVRITIHQLSSVPLVHGKFGVRWREAHLKHGAIFEISTKQRQNFNGLSS